MCTCRKAPRPRTARRPASRMATSIISVLTGIPVRRDVAMTGEVTLRGRVLPIGGLKEKLLAALRAGIKTVIIPEENEKDLAEIPDNVKSGMTIVPVKTVAEVLKVALVRQPEADRLGRAAGGGDASRASRRWRRCGRHALIRRIETERRASRPAFSFWRSALAEHDFPYTCWIRSGVCQCAIAALRRELWRRSFLIRPRFSTIFPPNPSVFRLGAVAAGPKVPRATGRIDPEPSFLASGARGERT